MTTEGFVDCGGGILFPSRQCCLPNFSIYCNVNYACYTVGNDIGCYPSYAQAAPTNMFKCVDYLADPPSDCGAGCYACTRQSPYCSTLVAIESTTTATVVYCLPTSGIGTTTLGSLPITSAFGSMIGTTASPASARPLTTTTTGAALPIPTETSSSTSTPAPTTSSIQGRQLTNGAIAGIAIGSFLAVAIIIVLSIFLWKAHKRDEHPVVVQAPPVVYEPKDTPHHIQYGAPPQPPAQYPVHELQSSPAAQDILWRPELPEMDAHTVQQQHGYGDRPA